jgi:hypothetical protein
MQQDAFSPPSIRRLWGWLPVETPWLLGAGILFHFLAQIRWDQHWEGFVYDPILRWWLPLVFFSAALYVGLGALPRPKLRYNLSLNYQWFMELALPTGAVLYVMYIDPIVYVDDAGFILRYLDHFADGCFYCFNVEDGPVFGISSFVYGLLAGLLTWSHLFKPEGALNFLTYAGIFATGFLFFRVLQQVVKSDGAVLLMWAVLMTCSRSIALIYNSGMEAPVHFAIVLAALLFFLQKRDRPMWLLLAISVISKLDAVPLVLVVALFWLIENWGDLKQFDWYKRRYRDALLYGLVPVLVWIGFATLVFGGPMPQSAYAKLYIRDHALGSWFPFLEGLMNSGYQSVFLAGALTVFVAHVGFVAARGTGGRRLVFGFAFLATLALYYFYNPGERMLWYYVLPEGLMLLQLCVSLEWAWSWLPRGKWMAGSLLGVSLVTGFAFMFTWIHTQAEINYQREYQATVEGERLRVGRYLQGVVEPEETLQSGHGLTSRHSRGYVIDETGLNCKLASDLKMSTDRARQSTILWDRLRPSWVVMHGYTWEVDSLNHFPYVLDTSFFDITTYGYPTWRVFKRVPTIEESEGTYFLQLSEVLGQDVEVTYEATHFLHLKAGAYSFVRQAYNKRETKITLGLLRHEYDYKVHVRDMMPGDTTVWRQTYTVGCYEGMGNPRLCALTIPLLRQNMPADLPPGPRYIILEFENSYGKVAMYDPAISILRRDP